MKLFYNLGSMNGMLYSKLSRCGNYIDGAIGSVKEMLCGFFRSRAAPSISAVSADKKT